MSKKIQSKIEELLFEVYEKGLQQETTDLTAYYKKIEQVLNIPVVSVECEHPFAYVHTRCMGEINTCLKCGKDL